MKFYFGMSTWNINEEMKFYPISKTNFHTIVKSLWLLFLFYLALIMGLKHKIICFMEYIRIAAQSQSWYVFEYTYGCHKGYSNSMMI